MAHPAGELGPGLDLDRVAEQPGTVVVDGINCCGDNEGRRQHQHFGSRTGRLITEAFCLADRMIRRTSTFFWEAVGGLSTVQAVADELERLMPWEPGRKQIEIEQYRRLVRQQRPALTE